MRDTTKPAPAATPVKQTIDLPISPSFTFTAAHLKHVNDHLEKQSVENIMRWCAISLPNLVQVTSFGPTGMVMIDIMHKLGLQLPTIWLDTLHHFPETIEHAKAVTERYGLDLRAYHCATASSRAEFNAQYSSTLWKDDPVRYGQLTKVEPLARGLREAGAEAWITGRRRDQGGLRGHLDIVQIDKSTGRIKVNALAHWTYKQIWKYIVDNNVPYNPLHDEGYKSVGDMMTTRKVGESDDERSGRFSNGQTECGIHC